MTDYNHIDYTHARQIANNLLDKSELLNQKNTKLLSESLVIDLHITLGLASEDLIRRSADIIDEIKEINKQLLDISNNLRFMRRMTELNLPINFN